MEGNRRPVSRRKVPPIETMGQLIHGLYADTFKRKKLTRKDVTALNRPYTFSADERQALLRQAGVDRTLDKTLRLLLFGLDVDSSVVTVQLGDFVRDVLEGHPAFGKGALTGSERSEIRIVASRDYLALSWDDSKKLTKREAELCRRNALHCALLYFRMMREMSLDQVRRYLMDYLWKRAASRCTTDTARLRALAETRDPSVAAVVCTLFEKQATEQDQRVDIALRRAEHAENKARDLDNSLKEALATLEKKQTEATELQTQLEQERQAHTDSKVRLRDGYEKLRGRLIGRLKAELSLLDDGLDALRRDPPKVHVMLDHAERATDDLRSELDRLLGDRGN